ncbi:virB8 family protein (plasmid) [Ampullimonas aquatilis]|uniref:virB8 family protein n=1 Tax=Ampullimonas aquatilis TaxID=1341549 RepID=UPI003C770963
MNWESDKAARSMKSERRAWWVAGIASTLAIVSVIGIATLAPFRTIVPHLYIMDKATGNIELVNALDNRSTVGYQELEDKYWAKKYITYRESYYYTLLQSDYDNVLALSTPEIGQDYAKLYDGNNARDKKYGANTEIKINVISVSLNHDDVSTKAIVRFEKTIKRANMDNTEPPNVYVATIAYKYEPSMFGKEKDLIMNPLGYKVVGYRVDSELSRPTVSAQQPTSGANTTSTVPAVETR